MNKKNLLYGTLITGGAVAASRLLFARQTTKTTISTDESHADVDAYIQEQMRGLKIPGVSLIIIKNDRIVHFRGFGLARPGGEVPALQTPFFIGSLTKSFTALAVMQLVEAGKVELDDPVQRYLPWFHVADPEASVMMTVRHLLNQTSGLPYFTTNLVQTELDDQPGATERQVRRLSTVRLSNPPGGKCKYSNWNFDILGLIIEAASAETYADYIRKHIFDPLEMQHSFTTRAAAQLHGLAVGHRHWFGNPVPALNLPIRNAALPSGGLISCAEDMGHYLLAHLNHGQYGGRQVLSAAGMDELHRGAVEFLTFGISSGSYAMGWFDQELGNLRVISHSGNVPDFSAYMAFIPEQQTGLVMLLNADPYGLPPITEEFGMNTTAVLTGMTPGPDKLDFIQWIFRLLPLIPLLQLMSAIHTLQTLQRWKRQPNLRPDTTSGLGKHMLLPLIPNLSLAAGLVYLRSSGLIKFLDLFMPDLAWIARITGSFAFAWCGVRTGLLLRTMGKHRQ